MVARHAQQRDGVECHLLFAPIRNRHRPFHANVVSVKLSFYRRSRGSPVPMYFASW